MAASTLTTVAYIYKRLYSDKAVGDLAKRAHPLFSMMAKEDGFTGNAFFYPIRYGNPQGLSALFAKAQANAGESKGIQLQASRKAKYGVITLDGEAMAAAAGDKGAFLTLVTQETDGVIEEMGDTLAFDLFRDGSGNRGQVSSGAGTGASQVITLAVADTARNFKVGMWVVASVNADGSSPRTGHAKVVGVDEDAGTVTLDNSVAGNIAALANSDYLFREGDQAACVEGLASHLPKTAPTGSDTFRGLTAPGRGADPRRLAGVRVDDPTTSIEENAGLTAVKLGQVGKPGDRKLFLNPINFWSVARRLNAKVEYPTGGEKANAFFEGFDLYSPAGTLRAVSDPDCPTDVGYVLSMSTWYIKHLKGLPHVIEDDGRPSLRSVSEDSIEARIRCWWNTICREPGANGRFSI